MGVTSSKDVPYSEYSLFQDGLTIEAITVVRNSKRDQDQDIGTAGSSATLSKTWRMAQNETEDLEFDAEEAEDGMDGTRSAQIAWVSDPESSRKNPKTALIKLEIREHEQLTFTFDVKALAGPLADSTISIADSTSPAELEQLLLDRKRSSLQHHPALSIIDATPNDKGQCRLSWTYPRSERLTGSHRTAASTASQTGPTTKGKRYCAILAYQPHSDTFHTLAGFSFWLDVLPSPKFESYGLPLPPRLPSPTPFSETVSTPATDYLSPQPVSANRRISWQNDGQARPHRFSYQSDASRSLSGSPGTANEALSSGFNWQQQVLPKRPVVQRSATSPSLGPTPAHEHPPPSPQALEAVQLPQLDPIEDIPEDGPLFKAHCKGMEERAYYLRRSLKHVVRAAEAVANASRLLDEAEDAFDVSLHEIAEYSPNSIQALNDVYWDTARRVQGFARKEGLLRLEELVVEPLRRLITILKAADIKKKAYEQESKAFYEHVNKYLGVKNDNTSSGGKTRVNAADEKYKSKKDRFTIARLDYYNSLRDLAVFKECMTLAILTHYAHAVHDIVVASGRDLDSSTMALDDLDLRLDALSAEIDQKKVVIESKRRQVEKSLAFQRMDIPGPLPEADPKHTVRDLRRSMDVTHLSPQSDNLLLPANGSMEALALSVSPETDTRWLHPPPSPNLPLGNSSSKSSTSDLQAQLRRKEGFLWVNSRPITHQGNIDSIKHWHKTWVVLAGGQLCEYADDRLELNSQPLNLRFATAREARTQERRFAFEVITPSVRRVYQATSAEEAQTWLRTLLNVIQSLLDGTSSVRQFVRPAHQDHQASNELGLGIFADSSRSPQPQSYATPTKEAQSSDGMRGMLAKLNKPLQRRSSGNHRKRDSVTSLVANLANNVRPSKRDKDAPRQLATLLEASQSMASFFSDTPRPPSASAHAKFASGDLESHRQYRDMHTGFDTSSIRTSPPRTEAELDQGIAAAVNTTFGPTRPGKLTQAGKEHNLRELIQLQRMEENRKCADCHASDPRWASWNLGIFVCIRCSGVHRALGTHISKVRSLDLDDWSDEQLQCMKEGGNRAARVMYEPPDLPPELRSDGNIANLIRMKYAEHRWKT